MFKPLHVICFGLCAVKHSIGQPLRVPSRQRKCLQFTDILWPVHRQVCRAKDVDEFVNLDGSFILVAFTKHALLSE